MHKFTTLAMMSVSALAVTTATASADYTLNILHINDLHSRIESINKYDSTCGEEDEAEGACFGGVARLITAAEQARERLSDENVVFLNAGDNFQGSLFYTTYKGEAEAEFLNLMGTDVMTIGNHEFDDGEPGLSTFLDEVEFPVVSANVVTNAESELIDKIEPYVVLDIGGAQVGVVGAVANDTAELSSPGENVSIEEDVAKITEAVESLQGEGVDKIIALTHVGYPRDLEAIAKISGVDVVVGGHTNTLLSNTEDGAAGPYPTMVENPDGYEVPVVQAYAYSKYLGELKVVFDDEGVVTSASGDPVLLDSSIEPDAAAMERIAELAEPIEELKNQVIGETSGPIEGNREFCRAEECQMGNLVADAMLDRTADQGVQIAIQNGGGLRASIDEGEVTMGEVLSVLPFQNTLATFELKGSDVVAALENGVSQIEEGAGRFPQVAGIKYTFDPEAEPGSRISDVMVSDGNGGFEPIDPDATYGVASNNFMRAGGDGYTVFAENGMNAYDYGPGVEQVVADYIAENSPYEPYTDGRITVASSDDEASMEEETMDESSMEEETDTADDAAMTEEDTASDMTETEETEITVPETSLSAGSLSTESPKVETDDAASDDGTEAMEDESMDEEAMSGSDETMEASEEASMEASDEGMESSEETSMASDEAAMDDESVSEEAMSDSDESMEATEEASMESSDEAMESSEETAMASDEATMDEEDASMEAASEETTSEEDSSAMASAEDTMEATDSMDGSETHVIEQGDTYWDLAREFYGDPTMWTKLDEANPGYRTRGLPVGEELVVPAADAGMAAGN